MAVVSRTRPFARGRRAHVTAPGDGGKKVILSLPGLMAVLLRAETGKH